MGIFLLRNIFYCLNNNSVVIFLNERERDIKMTVLLQLVVSNVGLWVLLPGKNVRLEILDRSLCYNHKYNRSNYIAFNIQWPQKAF